MAKKQSSKNCCNNSSSNECCSKDHEGACCGHEIACCGTAQVGERGQVVIPADARKAMNLRTGEKLITFLKNGRALIMMKAEDMDFIVEEVTRKIENIKKKVKK